MSLWFLILLQDTQSHGHTYIYTHYTHHTPHTHSPISWTIGPVRVISFNTEFYFFLWYGRELIGWQYEWLEEQLKMANTPEERSKYPWIITIAHHPMYCTTLDGDDCDHYNSVVSKGLQFCTA